MNFLLLAAEVPALDLASFIQLAAGVVISGFAWSLKRNVDGVDTKLTLIDAKVDALGARDNHKEVRLATIEIRLAALERGRRQTGEHEAIR